jgi:hypothetical protein
VTSQCQSSGVGFGKMSRRLVEFQPVHVGFANSPALRAELYTRLLHQLFRVTERSVHRDYVVCLECG